MKISRVLIILILLTTLSACMGVKFTYNNLDWLLPWYVEDYIELTDAQESHFEREFDDLWLWHRKNELPKYVNSLLQLEKDLSEKSISMPKLESYQKEARQHYLISAETVVSRGIDLLSTLSDEQMADIKDIIAEQMAEDEEYLFDTSKEERIKKRIRSVQKNFRGWIGKLTDTQKDLVAEWGLAYESLSEYRHEYRKASRDAFLAAMEKRQDKDYLQQRLLFLVFERDQLHSEEHLQARERNRQRMQQLMLAIEDSLTKKQRKRLVNRIENYRESFEELTNEEVTSD